MSAEAPGLDQLRELPLPAPVPYWPQTWGWLVLAVILLGLLGGGLLAAQRHRRRNRYRREALAELGRLDLAVQADPLALRALPGLIKRTALAAQPGSKRGGVGALSGEAWVRALATGSVALAPDSARLLALIAYAPDDTLRGLPPAQTRQLLSETRAWMERHHVAA
ncbi:DUF4381 domain-containing protein [Achromobacter sp. SIMBA_011]|uniref:DUF4381 domain-containing protein n=1 Tax=Achromobacter TaxID=222 RepID=UPI0022B8BAE0|nr:DUF4381 domain-containing protein [Achromobacter dolens]MCZ8406712.1 DUF4381 domain-containing protein [Achromobacter dolens]